MKHTFNDSLKYLYFDEIEIEVMIKCLEVVRDYSESPDFILEYVDVILEKLKLMRDD